MRTLLAILFAFHVHNTSKVIWIYNMHLSWTKKDEIMSKLYILCFLNMSSNNYTLHTELDYESVDNSRTNCCLSIPAQEMKILNFMFLASFSNFLFLWKHSSFNSFYNQSILFPLHFPEQGGNITDYCTETKHTAANLNSLHRLTYNLFHDSLLHSSLHHEDHPLLKMFLFKTNGILCLLWNNILHCFLCVLSGFLSLFAEPGWQVH